MKFLKNSWHMIAWSSELQTGQFVHRKICDEPLLVYRLTTGEPAAIHDRCPHRFVPLHMGKQVGNHIQCGYHGLCFGPDGTCVKNPRDNAPIPAAAKVKAYPVCERHGIIWAWMGDTQQASTASIPDFGFLTDPALGTVSGYMLTKANYQLAMDNLADLSHIQYVHAEYQASEAFGRIKTDVKQVDSTVYVYLVFPNGRPPKIFANAVPDVEAPIDIHYEVRWDAPSSARLTVRGYRPGELTDPLFEIQSAHIVSAESERSCHYFFGNSRNYSVGDPAADEAVREWQRIGFVEQDKPMLEAQQVSVGDVDIMALKPILLTTDAGAVRIRRTLQSMIDRDTSLAG